MDLVDSNGASLKQRAVAGTIWLTASQYGSSAVSLGGNLALARILGPQAFGVFFVISSLNDLLFVFGTFSFSQYLVQAPRITRRHYRAVLAWSALLAAAVLILAGCGAVAFRREYASPAVAAFLCLAVIRMFWNFIQVMFCVLERTMAYRQLGIARFVAAVASVMLAVALAMTGAGLWSLVARELGSAIAGALLAWQFLRRTVSFESEEPSDAPYRDVWRFGARLSLVQILEQLFTGSMGCFWPVYPASP